MLAEKVHEPRAFFHQKYRYFGEIIPQILQFLLLMEIRVQAFSQPYHTLHRRHRRGFVIKVPFLQNFSKNKAPYVLRKLSKQRSENEFLKDFSPKNSQKCVTRCDQSKEGVFW